MGCAATCDRWPSLDGKSDGGPCVVRSREQTPPDHAARARLALGLVLPVHRDRPARPRPLDADPAADGLRRPALAVYVRLARHRLSVLRPYVRRLALLGVLNTALPFFLITWGQQYIDSGLASIFNASAPLLTARLRVRLRPEPALDRDPARRDPARLHRRRPARRRRALRQREGGGRRPCRGGRGRVLRARRALRRPALPGRARLARLLRLAALGDAARAAVRRRAGERARLGSRACPCCTWASLPQVSPTSSTSV